MPRHSAVQPGKEIRMDIEFLAQIQLLVLDIVSRLGFK
jgi:hypothetical protein